MVSCERIALKLVLVQLIYITFIISPLSATTQKLGFRVNLRRRDDQTELAERLQSALQRSQARASNMAALFNQASVSKSFLEDSTTVVESPVRVGEGTFLMDVGVGTPIVKFQAIADTGSDLIWTQCMPCEDCYSQNTPIFNPANSSTYSTIQCKNSLCTALGDAQTDCVPACVFSYTYGDGSFTRGDLSYETFTIGRLNRFRRIAIGCGHDNHGLNSSGGLVGLGRGPLSLISQLGSKIDNKFSYCLLPITDSPSKSSPMLFGSAAELLGGNSIQVINNTFFPSFYYISLAGITVQGSALEIPNGVFDINPDDGSGGMIIDSGTTITYLPESAYTPLREAIQNATKLSPINGSNLGLDLCFQMQSDNGKLPSITLNFKGGVDYELPASNSFVSLENGVTCLAFSAGTSPSLPAILGNIQQQNFHILYDNGKQEITFQPADCDSV